MEICRVIWDKTADLKGKDMDYKCESKYIFVESTGNDREAEWWLLFSPFAVGRHNILQPL